MTRFSSVHVRLTLLLCVILMALSVAPVGAQTGTIEGVARSAQTGVSIPGARVTVVGTVHGATTGSEGYYRIEHVPTGVYSVRVNIIGFQPITVANQTVEENKTTRVDFTLQASILRIEGVVVQGVSVMLRGATSGGLMSFTVRAPGDAGFQHEPWNREAYDRIVENAFLAPTVNPLSTFGVDVDRASYSNMRRFVLDGELPPIDAVRLEEFVNYFPYDYAEPEGDAPVAIHTELTVAPWQPKHQLLRVGLQARRIETDQLPPSNFVFLIDVSGSMAPANKLPLLKAGLHLLVDQLRAEDRVSIVVYAGAAGLVLSPTPGDLKTDIHAAIDRLGAGGSTAGGAGIRLAYDQAIKAFIEGGNNRVILATDGDFNVGESSDAAMVRLIEEKRETGVFLTVLGFGEGNLQDSKMEKIADQGNGNYAYVDNLLEAKKVLVEELGGTLYTVAKDVKLQVEFNPNRVRAYRLIGYENRLLAAEDFDDDAKDAGDVGSGHSVTALYEIVPVDVDESGAVAEVEALRYQTPRVMSAAASRSELAFIKIRYKDPDGERSRLLEYVIDDDVRMSASMDFAFQSAVVEFGLLLRDSQYRGAADLGRVIRVARASRGDDPHGYRAEFVRLAELVQTLGVERTASR